MVFDFFSLDALSTRSPERNERLNMAAVDIRSNGEIETWCFETMGKITKQQKTESGDRKSVKISCFPFFDPLSVLVWQEGVTKRAYND